MSSRTDATKGSGSRDSLFRNALPMISGAALLVSFFFILATPEIRKNVLDDARYAIIVLFPLVGILIGAIAVVISWAVIRPIQGVFNRLHTLDVESDETLTPPRGHESDEIGCLVKDTNDVISRLRTSLEQQRELRLQLALSEKFRLPATMFENSPNGILITDCDNRIIRTNRAFTEITGYTEDEALGKDPGFMASGRHEQEFYEKMWKELLTFGCWTGELWNRCKDGHIRPEWFSISVVRADDGKIVNHTAVFFDISKRKMAEDRLDFLAHHDPLTLLPTRVLVRERFFFALASAAWDKRCVALLRVGLDGLKDIIDTFGRQVGDQLLLSVSKRLKDHVRGTDPISRENGDGFMILLPGIKDLDIVHRISADILEELAEPFDIAGQHMGISANIGIACYPQHGGDFDTMLKKAELAMRVAKNSGENTYRIFTDEMDSDADSDASDKRKLQAAPCTSI
jgi:diguanylate cyclase (GGDEF)-like protein/PAS domain S-box-containing protein